MVYPSLTSGNPVLDTILIPPGDRSTIGGRQSIFRLCVPSANIAGSSERGSGGAVPFDAPALKYMGNRPRR